MPRTRNYCARRRKQPSSVRSLQNGCSPSGGARRFVQGGTEGFVVGAGGEEGTGFRSRSPRLGGVELTQKIGEPVRSWLDQRVVIGSQLLADLGLEPKLIDG